MKRPRGHTAVMADKAPAVVEADSQLVAHQRRVQLFPSPPWAIRAGCEVIMRLDPGDWTAWEPACGLGHGVHGMKPYFRSIRRTDICDHGWDGLDRVQDFLTERDAWHGEKVDWILTNPPFGQAAEFVRLGLLRARRGVAMLCRLSFYESAGRFDLFHGEAPLTVLAPFFERVPMALGGWDPNGSTATAYAWFIWMHAAVLPPWLAPLCAERAAVTLPIAPGSKVRLTHPDDARLFGRSTAAPLLEALDG